jgi:hypothetical protein
LMIIVSEINTSSWCLYQINENIFLLENMKHIIFLNIH